MSCQFGLFRRREIKRGGAGELLRRFILLARVKQSLAPLQAQPSPVRSVLLRFRELRQRQVRLVLRHQRQALGQARGSNHFVTNMSNQFIRATGALELQFSPGDRVILTRFKEMPLPQNPKTPKPQNPLYMIAILIYELGKLVSWVNEKLE